MKRLSILGFAAALAASAAFGAWVYDGTWGSTGSGDGQFDEPWDVGVAPDGTVFVTDPDNDRVQYFTPSGSFLGKWGKHGEGNGEFDDPTSVDISADGKRVYVADEGNSRVQYFKKRD
jgi:tripartite motif-containing protein 71